MTNPAVPSIDLPTPATGTVYYRQRRILLLASNLFIGADDKTHDRKAIRVLVGLAKPIELAFNDGSRISHSVVVLSPEVSLCEIQGLNNDVVLMDVAPATPEYVALQAHLAGRQQLPCDDCSIEQLRVLLKSGQDGSLSCEDVYQIMQTMVFLVTGARPQPLQLDSRVVASLELIETLPLADINLATLSKAANLSSDRFRHLFKEVIGCTVSEYARQTALWRALEWISQGNSVTAASHAAGFHDVSHLYKAYFDTFGVRLSEKNNLRKFKRVRCFN